MFEVGTDVPAQLPGQDQRGHRRMTGVLLVAVPVLFMVFFTLLQARFEYPDILRRPAAEVLTKFHAGGPGLTALWYGMFASALLFIPLAVAARRYVAAPRQTSVLVAGVLAGLVQAVGLCRWVFVVPWLATGHADVTTGESKREAIVVAFNVLNHLMGVGIGEHLGFLFTAAWTALLSLGIGHRRPLAAWLGLLLALGILSGLLEPAGVAWAGTVNAIAYSAWSLWLVVIGVLLWRGRITAA